MSHFCYRVTHIRVTHFCMISHVKWVTWMSMSTLNQTGHFNVGHPYIGGIVMSVNYCCWQFLDGYTKNKNVGDISIIRLNLNIRYWSLVLDVSDVICHQHSRLVTNTFGLQYLSTTSVNNICQQHLSTTSVTNIDATKLSFIQITASVKLDTVHLRPDLISELSLTWFNFWLDVEMAQSSIQTVIGLLWN